MNIKELFYHVNLDIGNNYLICLATDVFVFSVNLKPVGIIAVCGVFKTKSSDFIVTYRNNCPKKLVIYPFFESISPISTSSLPHHQLLSLLTWLCFVLLASHMTKTCNICVLLCRDITNAIYHSVCNLNCP